MLGDIFVSSRRDALGYEHLLERKLVAPPRFELLEWKGITDVDVSVLWATLLNERYDPKRHQLLDLVFHSHANTLVGKLRMRAAILRTMAKELIGGENAATFLFAFPAKLVTALANLPAEKIQSVVEAWLQALQKNADRNAEFIEGLNKMRGLAISATSSGRSIYLWVGV